MKIWGIRLSPVKLDAKTFQIKFNMKLCFLARYGGKQQNWAAYIATISHIVGLVCPIYLTIKITGNDRIPHITK